MPRIRRRGDDDGDEDSSLMQSPRKRAPRPVAGIGVGSSSGPRSSNGAAAVAGGAPPPDSKREAHALTPPPPPEPTHALASGKHATAVQTANATLSPVTAKATQPPPTTLALATESEELAATLLDEERCSSCKRNGVIECILRVRGAVLCDRCRRLRHVARECRFKEGVVERVLGPERVKQEVERRARLSNRTAHTVGGATLSPSTANDARIDALRDAISTAADVLEAEGTSRGVAAILRMALRRDDAMA